MHGVMLLGHIQQQTLTIQKREVTMQGKARQGSVVNSTESMNRPVFGHKHLTAEILSSLKATCCRLIIVLLFPLTSARYIACIQSVCVSMCHSGGQIL